MAPSINLIYDALCYHCVEQDTYGLEDNYNCLFDEVILISKQFMNIIYNNLHYKRYCAYRAVEHNNFEAFVDILSDSRVFPDEETASRLASFTITQEKGDKFLNYIVDKKIYLCYDNMLIESIYTENAYIFKYLLSKCGPLTDGQRDILMRHAREIPNYEIIQSLNENGIIFVPNDYGFQQIIQRNAHQLLQLYVDSGYNIQAYGDECLTQCATHGSYECLKIILSHTQFSPVAFNTPLITAAANGYTSIVQTTLDAGADVHAFNDGAICEAKVATVIELLIKAGADVNAPVLRYDVVNSRYDKVRLLLEAGATGDREFLLSCAAGDERMIKIINYFLE